VTGPTIVDVRRNALDDGPGIRSVVFFKGCPLRCVWCQNPETFSPRPQLTREAERCVECGACVAACPEQEAKPATTPQPRTRCSSCGRCVEVCPAGARRIAGERRDLEELVELLLRDEPFYRRSGGGVTFSGGEPAVNARFAGQLAAALRERDVHVLLETCGKFAWRAFAEHLLPHLSTVYFDLKLADDEEHRRYTGSGNGRIHENLRRLVESGGPPDGLVPRVPLIPGITDTDENLEAIAALLRRQGLARVALLPYNPLWHTKRRALDLELPYDHREWMPAEQVARCRRIFEDAGIEVIE